MRDLINHFHKKPLSEPSFREALQRESQSSRSVLGCINACALYHVNTSGLGVQGLLADTVIPE